MKYAAFLCLSLLAIFTASVANAEIAHPRIKWAFQTEGPIRGSAIIVGDVLYFGSADGFLYAVDKADGDLRWKFQTGGPIAGAPVVSGATLIVAGRSDRVYALDTTNGSVRWSFRMQPTLPTPTEWNFFTAPPVVNGKQVLVPSGDGHLYCLDFDTGTRRWAFKTGDSVRAAPLVVGDTIYQPSGDDHVYALSAIDGKLRWKFATAGVGYDLSKGFIRSDIFTRPSFESGLLVIGSRDGNVYAIDTARREAKWTFAYDSTWAMSTTVEAGTVYVGWSTNNKINALDLATGVKTWEFDAGSHTYTTALIVGDNAYWGSAGGKIQNLDKRTGALQWSYAVDSDIYSSLIHENDTLYFGTDDGRLVALGEGGANVHQALYLPADVPDDIRGFIVDPALGPHLMDRGYSRLDSPGALAHWLAARTKDQARSVVVFGFAQIPPEVIGTDPAGGPMRRYLESGGKVVWPWGLPNKVTFDANGKFVAYDPTVAARLLDIEFLEFEDTGNYFSRSTQAGRNWGMPAWLKTTFASLKVDDNVTVLATDEHGRAGAFVKSFHSRPGSGWVAFRPSGFNVPITAAELIVLERVASYALK
ncbi:MAG TPA: PQQ-binding-like beta-propeller repeat protein [Gemmatimonadaceae bacterium]|nr:PQQ-binding-like beta-propeller repeat protein [Gemmatimonadaceae bacterium]